MKQLQPGNVVSLRTGGIGLSVVGANIGDIGICTGEKITPKKQFVYEVLVDDHSKRFGEEGNLFLLLPKKDFEVIGVF